MYFDVEDARTADDALLTVQTMVFFELVDIERMLDRTHNPVADFINALTADVIDFAAARVFERFKADTAALNELATYPNLAARAQAIGYRIHKVVYRGYEANPRLQAMHNQAIERRTGLQLEAETEAQAQELADLKAERTALRSAACGSRSRPRPNTTSGSREPGKPSVSAGRPTPTNRRWPSRRT